jgi:hypothetical protein
MPQLLTVLIDLYDFTNYVIFIFVINHLFSRQYKNQ